MKVLHVTRLPITATAFLMPLFRAHRERGEVPMLACSDGPEVEAIEKEGVGVHRFPLHRTIWPWSLLRALRRLTGIIREQEIDWVFTHTPIASALARIASRLGGAKGTVYMAHGLSCAPRIAKPMWWLWYLVERALGLITDGLITTNDYDYSLARRCRMIRDTERIYRVNEVGVDVARFDALAEQVDVSDIKRQLGVAPDDVLVLMLAWTLPTKGVREFLTAARMLIGRGCGGHFVLAGHGPLDEEIAAFIRRNSLSERVHFLGWRRDAPHLLAACDVYTLPTYYPEGMPVSILEAMASGKPVVATRHRGCEDEVVDGVTGYLVEPRCATALASALERLIVDPALASRLGAAGRKRIDDGFRVEQCTEKILRAFTDVIGTYPEGRVGRTARPDGNQGR